MLTKQNYLSEKKAHARSLIFCFLHSTPHSFSFLFFFFFILVVGLSLDFNYEVKVSQKTLKKVKFFNKWQVVGRPDFPSISPVKSDRFFACKSGPIHKSSLSFGHFLKDFFPLLELGTKDIFCHKKG